MLSRALLVACLAAGATAFSPLSPAAAPRLAHRGAAAHSAGRRPAQHRVVLGGLAGTAALERTSVSEPPALAPWRQNFDLKAWGEEIRAVEKETREEMGEEDIRHLQRMRNTALTLYAVGLASAGFCPLPYNPLSAILMAVSICMRWAMLGHHTCHGGYNGVVGGQHRFHRSKFAKGPWRRFKDWCDWMLPEAWDVEHNYMHHYMLGESSDPDLLEKNAHYLRTSGRPDVLKFLELGAYMLVWKWYYYAPNTIKEMVNRQNSLAEQRGQDTVKNPFDMPVSKGDYGDATEHATMGHALVRAVRGDFSPIKAMAPVLAPYFVSHFVLPPLAFFVLFGQGAASCALANLAVAEVLTNIHSFVIIVPNHAGEDVYRFKTPVKIKSDEFYLRAVIGSVNYRTGGDANDIIHGWLNYQIEHHMWPDMSMLAYQRCAPKVKAICEKHGVPYVQENVFKRLWRTMEIGVGWKNMKVWENGD